MPCADRRMKLYEALSRRDDALLTRRYYALCAQPEFDWLCNGPYWLTVQEVAAGLGILPTTVRRYCGRGDFRGAMDYGHRVGWRIPADALITWIVANQQGKGR